MGEWDVWCQAHIDTVGRERAYPRYTCSTWNEAQKMLGRANRECQADPPGHHFILAAPNPPKEQIDE